MLEGRRTALAKAGIRSIISNKRGVFEIATCFAITFWQNIELEEFPPPTQALHPVWVTESQGWSAECKTKAIRCCRLWRKWRKCRSGCSPTGTNLNL